MFCLAIALVTFASFWNGVKGGGCPERAFLGCVLRLKAQRVPFERNMLSVVFNVDSEAKLKRTCSAYSNIMPCFRDKINDCGDDKQRRMLNEVGKMIMFLCSPFSVDRQRRLLLHNKCISDMLSQPATTGCDLKDHHYGKNFFGCKRVCSTRPTDFICMMKTWISEQNICAVRDVEKKCGNDAANFYVEMQSTVFEPLFPLICDYDEPSVTSSTVRSIVIGTVAPEVQQITDYKPVTKVPRPEIVFGKASTKSPLFWITVTPSKKTKENSSAIFTTELLATPRPQPFPPTSSRPMTVLSLFHKFFPISSAIPDKIKNIIDTKFPGLAIGSQVATTVKDGYSDGHLSATETGWTTPIADIKWEVPPLEEPSTNEPILVSTGLPDKPKTNATTPDKSVFIVTSSTVAPRGDRKANTYASTASAQLSPPRRWRPWYLAEHRSQKLLPS